MALTTTMRVMILVKAAPVLTSQLQESMCVAAMSLDEPPRWIRLHPVPFRDLQDTTKFRKYQEVTVEVFRPKSDRRPESWTPIEGSITPGATIGTDHAWSTRRQRVSSLGSDLTMCELVAMNRSGSGPDTPSLAVVRTREARSSSSRSATRSNSRSGGRGLRQSVASHRSSKTPRSQRPLSR